VVVSDSAVGAVADRILSQEAVLGQIVLCAIGRRRTAAAPDLGQVAAVVCIDEVFDDRVELIDAHVAPICERQLVSGGQALQVTRCLGGTEIAAEGERGQEVALNGVRQLWLRAREWTEVARPLRPEIDDRQNVEQAPLRHAVEQRGLKGMRRR
jgi:hypothetical protein